MMLNDKQIDYGSVAEEESTVLDVESFPAEKDATNRVVMKFTLATVALLGCFVMFAGPSVASVGSSTVSLVEQSTTVLNLPSYLTALGPNDPEWPTWSPKLTDKWVIGAPEKGNMIPGRVDIVKFTEPHFVFRYYGGHSNQCGYWWVLDPPTGTEATYSDHFAICPEYGPKADIVRCRIPQGYIAVVGEGQSVKCSAGNVLKPDPQNYQMSADVCNDVVKMQNHLACEYCTADNFSLESSSCSNTGADYIDTFVFGN